ncbi:Single-stranded DNA-binding protein WHY2, mitochondrial [Coccomyxa sp. Obi]|nr:Single-stranded DNA-binding protein WHY2, mitochondrial [Coccomyxa sp. Obi]
MLLPQVGRMAMTQGRAMAASRLGNRVDLLKLAHRRSQHNLACYSSTAPAQVQPSQQRNLYANFAIYKGKAAASFRVRKPRWVETQDGSISLDRAGSLIVEFAPVAPGSGTNVGNRSYQWDKKQTFALSPVELAGIIESTTTGKSMKELFHDPNKGGTDSGKIAKTLTLQRFDQGQDWYLQLAVKDSFSKEGSTTMGLPITGAELYTLKTLSEFLIPRLLGWDEVLAEPELVPANGYGSRQ